MQALQEAGYLAQLQDQASGPMGVPLGDQGMVSAVDAGSMDGHTGLSHLSDAMQGDVNAVAEVGSEGGD